MMSFAKTVTLKHITATTYTAYNEPVNTYSTAYYQMIELPAKNEYDQEGQNLVQIIHTYLWHPTGSAVPVRSDLIDNNAIEIITEPAHPGLPYMIITRQIV